MLTLQTEQWWKNQTPDEQASNPRQPNLMEDACSNLWLSSEGNHSVDRQSDLNVSSREQIINYNYPGNLLSDLSDQELLLVIKNTMNKMLQFDNIAYNRIIEQLFIFREVISYFQQRKTEQMTQNQYLIITVCGPWSRSAIKNYNLEYLIGIKMSRAEVFPEEN